MEITLKNPGRVIYALMHEGYMPNEIGEWFLDLPEDDVMRVFTEFIMPPTPALLETHMNIFRTGERRLEMLAERLLTLNRIVEAKLKDIPEAPT